MSPEEFASQEEWEKSTWGRMSKEKVIRIFNTTSNLMCSYFAWGIVFYCKHNNHDYPQVKKKSPTRRTGPVEPQSELLTDELQKQSYASVSKHLGEKILGDALGAMHSSMVSKSLDATIIIH